MMKKCSTCNLEKELTEFYRCKASCKECRSIYNRNYHKSKRESLLLHQKKYYKANKLKIKQRAITFYKDNVVIIRERENERIKNLSDHYIKEKLKRIGYKLKDITPELIEVKRLLIKINRLIK